MLVVGNMLPVSRQHVSLCIQQQTGNKLATILLTATSNIAWCKCGFTGKLSKMEYIQLCGYVYAHENQLYKQAGEVYYKIKHNYTCLNCEEFFTRSTEVKL